MNHALADQKQRLEKLAAEGVRHLPIIREVVADFETPLSCYAKVASGPYSYLLESANQGGEKWARYSMIGLPARRVYQIRGHSLRAIEDGAVVQDTELEDPFSYVAALQAEYSYPEIEGLPTFTGGLVGYFGYDTVRYVEPRLKASTPPDSLGTPDILLMLSDEVIVFDNVKGKVQLVTHVSDLSDDQLIQADLRLDAMQGAMLGPLPDYLTHPNVAPAVYESDFESTYGKDQFLEDVAAIKEYILAGDTMQVILSQRLRCRIEAHPLTLYRALRALNPSPYMYYMDLDEFSIVSSSPEILARLEDGEVTVRPLAGTRRRGRSREEDQAMETELKSDPKEIAEHLMLIDLGRNDVGRVSQAGSVRVTDMMTIERYAHVMHIASHVTGHLLPGLTPVDVLKATLPVGTLSGAPKVRALEIIDEFEPEKRGIFGGAVGYLSWQGSMDTAIAIRTAIVKDGWLNVQAGAGIVADSVAELEWMETLNKARSIMRAAMIAERGLQFDETPENSRPSADRDERSITDTNSV
ncbi:MAG: anthranilate synthase component I [Pseudomonadales bacterium]